MCVIFCGDWQLLILVTLSGAEVDMVKGHETLQQMGGVGALLRYRPMWV
jgi:hypothetical protein